MTEEKSLDSIFQKKYTEFCIELLGTYSERSQAITAAKRLPANERMQRFRAEVLPTAGNPARNPAVTPGMVLPGVTIDPEDWASFSKNTQKAIQEYVTLLSFTCMFGDGQSPWSAADLSGNADANGNGNANAKAWMEDMLKQWKGKLNNVDFKSLADKMMGLFGTEGGASSFKLPEKFLKGQLAKLAEEMVREFKPEDFGLSPDQLGEDANPQKAFELLMNIYTQKPEILQNAMGKIAKRLQEKVRRGELKPQELAAEAEEMMKEFTDNPAFVDLMETFRSAFGFEDQEMARAAGRDGEGRLSLVQKRLRAKLEKKKGGSGKK